MTMHAKNQNLLALPHPPVAVAFLDSPPEGVAAWQGGPVAAGCVFWKRAQAGEIFYTTPADHYNCAVGAYTHRIALPEERATELNETLGLMVQQQYLAMNEVPDIPTLSKAPQYIAYGPMEQVSFIPDVVIVAAQPAQIMLLYEAAVTAGAAPALLNTLGRPACALLPLALSTGIASLSLGCIGNRVYTGLPAAEMYLCVPGSQWEAVTARLTTTIVANQAIETHHRDRETQFSSF